jgi:hypothetical protein
MEEDPQVTIVATKTCETCLGFGELFADGEWQDCADCDGPSPDQDDE